MITPCPFYPEGGGQVGDSGELSIIDARGETTVVRVSTAVRPFDDGIALLASASDATHATKLEAALGCAVRVDARVDSAARLRSAAHHTGTHMLHAALRAALGSTVMQSGSHVSPQRLRFDFSHNGSLTAEQVWWDCLWFLVHVTHASQVREVESWVNRAVACGDRVNVKMMPLEDAKASLCPLEC